MTSHAPSSLLALRIDVDTRPFERVECEVAVAGLFADDRPLRGGVARADWRLCGLLSELVREGRITGRDGECVLVPSAGRLRAPRLFIMGLGERTARTTASVQDLVVRTLGRVCELGLSDIALAPLGFAGDDWPRHAQAVVGGAWEAARLSGAPMDLHLAVPGSSEARARASLKASVDAFGLREMEFLGRDQRRGDDTLARPRKSPQGSLPVQRHF